MLRLMLLSACLVLTLLHRDANADEGGTSLSRYRWHTYALLLTAKDPARIKLGARELETTAASDKALADLAASALDDFIQQRRNLDADTVAWLTKGLAATGSLRYAELLKYLAAHGERKIAGYAKETLAKLKSPAPTFNSADVDMQAVLAQLNQENEQPPPTAGSIFDLHADIWIEDVFARLGYPVDAGVSTSSKRIPAPIPGRLYLTNLVLEYEKGRVEFSRGRGDWYVLRVLPSVLPVSPSAEEGQGPTSGALEAIRRGMMASDPDTFRMTARNAVRFGVTDQTVLDAAAWRLESEMNTTDKYMIDGLSHVCRMLGTSGNSRYRSLLIEVGSKAAHRKLRGYGARMAMLLLDQPVEQFSGRQLAQ